MARKLRRPGMYRFPWETIVLAAVLLMLASNRHEVMSWLDPDHQYDTPTNHRGSYASSTPSYTWDDGSVANFDDKGWYERAVDWVAGFIDPPPANAPLGEAVAVADPEPAADIDAVDADVDGADVDDEAPEGEGDEVEVDETLEAPSASDEVTPADAPEDAAAE